MPNDAVDADNVPELSIPSDKLCFIVEKAREFEVKDEVTDPDDASNPQRRRDDRRAGGP